MFYSVNKICDRLVLVTRSILFQPIGSPILATIQQGIVCNLVSELLVKSWLP